MMLHTFIIISHTNVPCSLRHLINIHILPSQWSLYIDYACEYLGSKRRFFFNLAIDVFLLVIAPDQHVFVVMIAHNEDFLFKSDVVPLFFKGF